MKKLILMIICTTLNIVMMGQTQVLEELSKISWQLDEIDNEFIERLFNQEQYLIEKIPEDKIVEVYDRYELKSELNNFFVTFLNYKSGNPIIRSIINKNTKIEYWNYFHDNGKIKLKGFTIGSIQQIGVWEKYSDLGELESKIDYEENRIDFEELYSIFKEKKLVNNDLDFKYLEDSKKWLIEDWTDKKKYIISDQGVIKEEELETN